MNVPNVSNRFVLTGVQSETGVVIFVVVSSTPLALLSSSWSARTAPPES